MTTEINATIDSEEIALSTKRLDSDEEDKYETVDGVKDADSQTAAACGVKDVKHSVDEPRRWSTISRSNLDSMCCFKRPSKFVVQRVGAVLVVLTLIGVILPPWVNRPSDDSGAGELEVTHGCGYSTGTRNGTRLLAPTFINAGEPIPPVGTVEASLLWIEDLCGQMLDCSSCPPQFKPTFDTSILVGTILIYNRRSDERLFMCGLNRLGRALSGAGPVALAYGTKTDWTFFVPGADRRSFRLGEFRDSEARDGIIPVPHVNLRQAALKPLLEALEEGNQIRAVLRPTQPNPFFAMFYGPWVPLRAPIVLGHLCLVERALCLLIGHVVAIGARFDFAQIALVAEAAAHTMYAISLFDPFMCFYYDGLLGAASVLYMAPTMLTCCSTLLLAGYWHQMITKGGLASFSIESRLGLALAILSAILCSLAVWLVITELFLRRDSWLACRIPRFNSFDYISASIVVAIAVFIVAILFEISAARAKRAITQWTDLAAGKRLMKRVRKSGCLMIGLTFAMVSRYRVTDHPLGFIFWYILTYPMVQLNSRLQIDSFKPLGGAPLGPMNAAVRRFCCISLQSKKKGSRSPSGRSLFARFTIVIPDDTPDRQQDGQQAPRRFSKARKSSITQVRKASIVLKGRVTGMPTLHPTPVMRVNTQDQLPPCDRLGLSLEFLDAFVEYYGVTEDMTTQDVCMAFIKPYTEQRQCVYQDLLIDEPDVLPTGWVGKTTHFASHWWGYRFLDVLTMLRDHSARLAAAGEPVAFYFFDAFSINQHTFFLGSTQEADAHNALVDSLRNRCSYRGYRPLPFVSL